MNINKQQSGFTLVELVVVIVILGILAAVAIPQLQGMDTDAKLAVVNGGLAAVQSSAVITYGKNRTPGSLATILANTALDSHIVVSTTTCDTNLATPDSVVAAYQTVSGTNDTGTSVTVSIPAGLCNG